MEGVVDMAHGCRKSELVSLKTNAFNHFERAKTLPIELLRRSRSGDIGGV